MFIKAENKLPIIEYTDKIVALFLLIDLFLISNTIGEIIDINPLKEHTAIILINMFLVNTNTNTHKSIILTIVFKVFTCPNFLLIIWVLKDNIARSSESAVIYPRNLISTPILSKCNCPKLE